MAKLKAWAVEKEKMYEGAYGEYFGEIIDPARIPRWRYDQWHLEGGRTELSDATMSRADKDRLTDREIEGFADNQKHVAFKGSEHEKGRHGADSQEEASSSRVPGRRDSGAKEPGFMKRKMSGLMKKMGMHEIGTEPGDNEEQGDPMRTYLSGGMTVVGPSVGTKKRMEAEKAAREEHEE